MKRMILLTGATGVLGGALLPELLKADGDAIARPLIRAGNQSELESRLEELFEFWGDAVSKEDRLRIRPVRGDITMDRLGLTPGDYDDLVRNCTNVIHAAANVKMNMSHEEAKTITVDGTRRLLAFSLECSAKSAFEKLDYVSTIGVAGTMEGRISEKSLYEVKREFHNTYESSKALAENILLEGTSGKLPLTIHRPSMIVGDSRDGKARGLQGFYYIMEFISGKRSFGIVPDFGAYRLDTVPVDYAAKIIAAAAFDLSTAGFITHICSGGRSMRLEDFAKIARKTMNGFPLSLKLSKGLFFTFVSMAEGVAHGKTKKALSNLKLFLPYLEASQTFDNTLTRARFSSIELPEPENYVERVMAYGLKVKDRRAQR